MSFSSTLKNCLRSRAGYALVSFAMPNAALALLALICGLDLANVDLIQNREVFGIILHQPTRADLLFLGSSVIEVPLSLLDDEHKFCQVPATAQKLLSSAMGRSLSVRNYSIEAALVSDQFLLMRHLISAQIAPQVVVLAVAPRDLVDARLPSPDQTGTFKVFFKLSDLNLLPLFAGTFESQAHFLWERLTPLYRFRSLTKTAMEAQLQQLISTAAAPLRTAPPPVAPENKSQDQSASDSTVDWQAKMSPDKAKRFAESFKEYKHAYSLIGKRSLEKTEFAFIPRLIDLTRGNNVKLIMINMPITALNKSLLPPGFYQSYSEQLEQMAKARDTTYINLDKAGFNDQGDFFDTGHLNAQGGKKLIDILAPAVKASLATPQQSLSDEQRVRQR